MTLLQRKDPNCLLKLWGPLLSLVHVLSWRNGLWHTSCDTDTEKFVLQCPRWLLNKNYIQKGGRRRKKERRKEKENILFNEIAAQKKACNKLTILGLQVFHANNSSFLIRAGTSNSHAADPVQLRMVQSCNGNFILHAAFQVIYGMTDINCGNSISWTSLFAFCRSCNGIAAVDIGHSVNDLESRMQNEIAVIELDHPQQNWIRRVWIGSAGFDKETAVIGVNKI